MEARHREPPCAQVPPATQTATTASLPVHKCLLLWMGVWRLGEDLAI